MKAQVEQTIRLTLDLSTDELSELYAVLNNTYIVDPLEHLDHALIREKLEVHVDYRLADECHKRLLKSMECED